MELSKKAFHYSSSGKSEITIKEGAVISHEDVEFLIETNMIGNHFKSNIAGAIFIAYLNGISVQDSLLAIKHFPGVRRRSEFIGIAADVSVYDDYAHHPTEIESVLNTIQTNFKNKSTAVVFQPHLFSRTRDFMDEFAIVLSKFDEVYLLDIYAAREKPIIGVSSQILLEKMEKLINISLFLPKSYGGRC